MTTNKFGPGNWMSPWGIVRAAGSLAVGLFLVSTNSARAQTFWFSTNTVAAVWSDPTTWSNELSTVAAPAAGGSNDYSLTIITGAPATNDLGTAANGGFLLNSLAFIGSGALTLTGSNLVLTTSSGGVLPQVTKSSSADNSIGTNATDMGFVLSTNTTFAGTGGNILIVSGLVSGPGGITMNGTYNLGLAAPTNTYSGDTIINSGLVQARVNNAFPFGAGRGNIIVNSGGTLSLNNVDAIINGLSGSGPVNKLGTNTRTLNIGANDVTSTFSGNFLVNGGAGNFLNINKIGTGVLTLAGTNLSGGQTIISSGLLVIAHSSAVTNSRVSPVGLGSVAFSNDTVFYFAALGPPGNAGTSTGSIGLTNTAGQAISLNVGNSNQGTFTTYSGRISGSGSLVKVWPAYTLRVQGTNAIYTGDTLINEGTLDVNFGGWFPFGPGAGNLFVGSTAVVGLRTVNANGTYNVNGLSGSGIIQGFNGAGTKNIVVGNNDASSTFSGIIRNSDPAAANGPLALTKVGTGTLTLTGTNDYSQGTTVIAGTLAIAGDGMISNTASITLGTGAFLDVSGRTGGSMDFGVATSQELRGFSSLKGNLNFGNSATLSPGTNSALGTLTFSNNLAFSASSVLNYRLGTSSDSVVVGGNLTLDGTLNVADSGGLTNTIYTLFTYGGTLTTNGSPTILTFGTLADSNFTYTVNIATLGQVKLVVGCPACAVSDPFNTWQTFYFGSTVIANAQGGADPDGDGMSNTNEFLAGFNPTNSAAYLHVISVVKTNNDMRIAYLGANGDSNGSLGPKTNVLEFTKGTANGSYSNNFASANVTNVLSGGTGVGVVTNMVDIGGGTNSPSRYYRVRVLVP